MYMNYYNVNLSLLITHSHSNQGHLNLFLKHCSEWIYPTVHYHYNIFFCSFHSAQNRNYTIKKNNIKKEKSKCKSREEGKNFFLYKYFYFSHSPVCVQCERNNFMKAITASGSFEFNGPGNTIFTLLIKCKI
jgi:hypothetical protein